MNSPGGTESVNDRDMAQTPKWIRAAAWIVMAIIMPISGWALYKVETMDAIYVTKVESGQSTDRICRSIERVEQKVDRIIYHFIGD